MAVNIKKGSALDNVNMTPMMDVIFQLLIFFMVAAEFSEMDNELDLQLPSASEAKPLTAIPNEIYINIDRNGNYYVGGKFLGLDEVADHLKKSVNDNPLNQSAVVRADKRVAFEAVVSVVNVLKAYNIAHVVTTEGAKK